MTGWDWHVGRIGIKDGPLELRLSGCLVSFLIVSPLGAGEIFIFGARSRECMFVLWLYGITGIWLLW